MNKGIRIVRRISGTMLVIGCIGWLGMFLVGPWLARYIPSSVQLPLSEISGPALDHEGRIYCVSEAYSRLQVYDPDGRFLRSWFVHAGGHRASVHVDADNRVHVYVYVATGPTDYVYDTRGSLLQAEKLGYGDQRPDGPSGPNIRSGYEYVVRRPSIWPQVVKVGADGRDSVVIRPNLLLWVFAGPFPAWLFAAFAIIVLSLTQRYVHKGSPQDGPSAQSGDRNS